MGIDARKRELLEARFFDRVIMKLTFQTCYYYNILLLFYFYNILNHLHLITNELGYFHRNLTSIIMIIFNYKVLFTYLSSILFMIRLVYDEKA